MPRRRRRIASGAVKAKPKPQNGYRWGPGANDVTPGYVDRDTTPQGPPKVTPRTKPGKAGSVAGRPGARGKGTIRNRGAAGDGKLLGPPSALPPAPIPQADGGKRGITKTTTGSSTPRTSRSVASSSYGVDRIAPIPSVPTKRRGSGTSPRR